MSCFDVSVNEAGVVELHLIFKADELLRITEEETEVKTETLSLKATALPDGLVKSKTCENTDETTYNNWYKSVYIPVTTAAKSSAKSAS